MRGSGLLQVICKLAEEVIDTIIKAVAEFHDVLLGFGAGRGMGMVILELKLSQELESVEQAPLFVVFLDLRKSYDTIDMGCLLQILKGLWGRTVAMGVITEILG